MFDGYDFSIYQKLESLKSLVNKQKEIDDEIYYLDDNLNKMNIPESFDNWYDSLSDFDKNKFSLNDYNKLHNSYKRYQHLIECRKINSDKIKDLMLDYTLFLIKDLEDKLNEKSNND